jgi:hypothetical protein
MKETEKTIYISFQEAERMTSKERKELEKQAEAKGKQIAELPIEVLKTLF